MANIEEQIYDDWLDPNNTMPDLEEEYDLRRQEIRDIIAEYHEPDF